MRGTCFKAYYLQNVTYSFVYKASDHMFIILFINDYKENIIDFYLRMIPCENKLELNNNGHIEFLKNCLVYI